MWGIMTGHIHMLGVIRGDIPNINTKTRKEKRKNNAPKGVIGKSRGGLRGQLLDNTRM